MKDVRGLTLIEVLVAIAVLGIIAAAIVGSLSLVVRLNLETADEIDYARVVRTVSESARETWADAKFWTDDPDASFLTDIVDDTGCEFEVLAPLDAAAETAGAVRVISVVCPAPANTAEAFVFQLEIGRP